MAMETIVNGTSIIVQESADYSWLGIVIASIIAMITFVGIMLTNRRMKESNDELKTSNELILMELKEKFRPRFKITNCIIQYESDQTNNAKFTCQIQNASVVAIHNMSIAYYISNRKVTPLELIQDHDDIWKQHRDYDATLDPTIILSDYEIYFQEKNKKNIWITLWFKFKSLNEENELIYQIHFEDLQYIGFDNYTHKQIEEAKKYQKDVRDGNISAPT